MVWQYRPEWVTESGGSGFSVFHADDLLGGVGPQNFADSVREMFLAMTSTLIPVGTSMTFPAEVLHLDTATGELIEVTEVGPPSPTVGSAAGAYSAPTGGRMRWNTPGIVAGRRVRGTTFWVPLIGTAYDDAGTLQASTVSTMTTAAVAYHGSMDGLAVVYSRPFEGNETTPARPGTEHQITSVVVPDRAAVLRSRRD